MANLLEGIKERASSTPALGSTLKFDFGEQIVYLDGTGDANVVTDEDKDADCVIKISEENFIALTKGELNPMMAVMSGKIKIKGDMGVAMKLQSLLA